MQIQEDIHPMDIGLAPPGGLDGGVAVSENHDRSPVHPGDVFFAEPPADCGEFISGSTNVNRAYKHGVANPWGAGRIFLGILGAVGGAIGGVIVGEAVARQSEIQLALIVLFGVVGFLLVSLPIQPKHECSFVCTHGLARFRRKGWKGQVRAESFLFHTAAQLRSQQITHYTNGVYSGNSYNFNWSGTAGSRMYAINGRYHRKKMFKDNLIHFAWSAESAWSLFKLPQLLETLDQGGSVKFAVDKNDWVAIGRGFIELSFKGQTERLARDDIAQINLQQGFMTITAVGAVKKLFSKQGIFTFGVAQTQDFRLFLLLLENETGIRVY